MFRRSKVGIAAAMAVSGLAVISSGVMAQDAQRVEITGSSIKRIDAETALPVQIVTREEISRSGVASTEQLLQSISAISSQGGLNNGTGVGNSTFGQSSVSLRGLGEDRTLVLVNGRRLAAFAGGNGASININAIPLAAIERVEILKDGASSTYGSDAMGGVINFILKKDITGFEVSATLGNPTRSGGGKSQRADIVAGFGNLAQDRFNVTLSAGLEKETALFAKDRNFAKTGNVPPFLSAAATGQGNIEGGYNPTPTPGTPFTSTAENTIGNTPGRQAGFGNSPGTGFGNPMALTNTCADIAMYLDATQTTKGAPFCTFDSNAFVGLVPKRELATFSGNLTFKLTENLQLFGDALYSKSEVTQQFQPSPVRRSFLVTDGLFFTQGVEPALIIRPTNPNYAIAANYLNAMEVTNPGQGFGALVGQPLAVTARVFDFGNRTSLDVSKQSRITGGIRGSFGSQDWEVAATQNDNKLSGTVPDGYFSQVAFARVVNAAGSDYNPWSLNQSAAFNAALAAAAAKYTGATLDARSKSTTVDGVIRGDVSQLPAGALQYAAGLQARKETFVTTPSPALETGDIAGLGGAIPPVDRERKIGSAFGELVVPIVKGLEGNVSVRSDHYNDVGNSTTYKASAKWQPMQMLAVRGSIGTGFRAPTLVDLWQPQTLGSSEQFNDPATGQNDLQVNSLTGGNPDLKPEKSRQSSIGVVLQPTPNASFGIDFFNIRVKDIISTPSAQEVVSRFRAGDPSFAGLVTLTPGTNDIESIIQTLQNQGTAKLQGIDVDANIKQDFGIGRLSWYFNGTYMIKFDQTSPGGSVSHKVGTMVDQDGNPVLSTNGVNDGVVLRWKHYLSATWEQGPWAFTFAQNFYKAYRDGNDLNGSPHFVPDTAVYDANITYTGIKSLTLRLGAKNVFDKDPPLYIPTSNQFQAGYDISLYDPRGRVVYVAASYKF
jgi:iron complex outermembrane receptor protein